MSSGESCVERSVFLQAVSGCRVGQRDLSNSLHQNQEYPRSSRLHSKPWGTGNRCRSRREETNVVEKKKIRERA